MFKHNTNGYFTDEELLEFKRMTDKEFEDKILRHFNTDNFKCPPEKYETTYCFECIKCMRNARELVKEKKVK